MGLPVGKYIDITSRNVIWPLFCLGSGLSLVGPSSAASWRVQLFKNSQEHVACKFADSSAGYKVTEQWIPILERRA